MCSSVAYFQKWYDCWVKELNYKFWFVNPYLKLYVMHVEECISFTFDTLFYECLYYLCVILTVLFTFLKVHFKFQVSQPMKK